MNTYEIIVTSDAATDLVELRNYIADVLLVPDVALTYIRAIRAEISKLANMPQRIAPVSEEPWHSRGIRKLIVKNFYIYFRIDENAKCIYILNIIYQSRDQLNILAEMDFD